VKSFKRMAPLLGGMIGLLALFRLWVPGFLAKDNMLDLAQQISVNAIIAFGMTLTILIGGIDLSVGALLALVGTTAVYVISQAAPEAQNIGVLALALGAGSGVAALCGLLNGWCAARTPIPPFIITLATMLMARGTALRFNEGRPMHVPETQTMFLALGNSRIYLSGEVQIPAPVLVMLAAFAFTGILLHKTRYGRHLFAIGGNREAARLSGLPLFACEVSVYLICSVLAGIAGLIHASQLYSAEPSAGTGFELNAIAAVVVGGTSFTGGIGSMHGTLIGAIIIGILDKGLNQAGVHFSLQYVMKGLVILGAVYMDVRRRRRA